MGSLFEAWWTISITMAKVVVDLNLKILNNIIKDVTCIYSRIALRLELTLIHMSGHLKKLLEFKKQCIEAIAVFKSGNYNGIH